MYSFGAKKHSFEIAYGASHLEQLLTPMHNMNNQHTRKRISEENNLVRKTAPRPEYKSATLTLSLKKPMRHYLTTSGTGEPVLWCFFQNID